MNSIKSDLGTEFRNEVMVELCRLLNIKMNSSTAYHHETVGTVERNHRVFNEFLRAYMNEQSCDWDIYLKYFKFFHNTTVNTVFNNKFTPYKLIFGKDPMLPKKILREKINPIYNIEN